MAINRPAVTGLKTVWGTSIAGQGSGVKRYGLLQERIRNTAPPKHAKMSAADGSGMTVPFTAKISPASSAPTSKLWATQ